MNTKAKGEITEAAILAILLDAGYSVSLPFGNNQRYDMIVDDGKTLQRVQCKTGRVQAGCIFFKAYSTNGFTGKQSGYSGQIDTFAVYCRALKKLYLVPVDKVGSGSISLRVEPARNGQSSGVRWAKDFEFPRCVAQE